MSLQAALISMGFVLLGLIYMVSKWSEKRAQVGANAEVVRAYIDQDALTTPPHHDLMALNRAPVLDSQLTKNRRPQPTISPVAELVELATPPVMEAMTSTDLASPTSSQPAPMTRDDHQPAAAEVTNPFAEHWIDTLDDVVVSPEDTAAAETPVSPANQAAWGRAQVGQLVDTADVADAANTTDVTETADIAETADTRPRSRPNHTANRRLFDATPIATTTSNQTEVSKPLADMIVPPNFVYPDIEGFDKISQIDYWVKLAGKRELDREAVLAQYREGVSYISHATRVFGTRVTDKEWQDLETAPEGMGFLDLVLTIQLTDHTGAISETALTKFTRLVSNLSESTGRGFVFMAPLESAAQQGATIAEFVRHYPARYQLVVRPCTSEYFAGEVVASCAQKIGLEPTVQNTFTRDKTTRGQKVSLYQLANLSPTGEFDFDHIDDMQIKGLTFSTHPACHQNPGAVYAEMVDAARVFAVRAKGEVFTDNAEILTDETGDTIRQCIETIADAMRALGLEPGVDEAIRLFAQNHHHAGAR